MANKSASSSGIGLGGVLFVVFLVLKLLGITVVAQWSWWWVTAPLWLPLVVVLAICGIAGIVVALVGALKR